MADKKHDGILEAVHYGPDGQVDWVRVYLRRGPTWSDRIIMRRQDLINEIQKGRNFMIGQRVEYMAGTFEVSTPVQVAGSRGSEVLTTNSSATERDTLEGAPVI